MSGNMTGQTAAASSSNASTTTTNSNGAGVAAGATLATGIASAYSELEASRYNARIQRMNEAVARAQSDEAIRRGEFGVNQLRLQGRRVIGAQRAAFAGGNISVDTGTAVDLANQVDRSVEMDVTTMRDNARLQAWGFDVGAADAKAKAQLAQLEGVNRAGEAVLGSASKASDTYLKLKDGA